MVQASWHLASLFLATLQCLELLRTHECFYLLMSLLMQLLNFLPFLLWREGTVATNRLHLASRTLVDLADLWHHRFRYPGLLPAWLRAGISLIGDTSGRARCSLCQQRTNNENRSEPGERKTEPSQHCHGDLLAVRVIVSRSGRNEDEIDRYVGLRLQIRQVMSGVGKESPRNFQQKSVLNFSI